MKSIYLFAKILVTGGIVLGLELASSRILTPFFGVSLYVWSGILSVTLIALALGYKFGGTLTANMERGQSLLFFASAGGLAALWLDLCLWTYPWLFWGLADFDLVKGAIIACLYLLFIPLLILSALNPLLVALLADDRNGGGRGAGNVFFISTVGSVLGVFVVAYAMLPCLTNYQTVGILTLASAGLSVAALIIIRDFGNGLFRRLFAAACIAFAIALATLLTGGLERFSHNFATPGATWKVSHTEATSFGSLKVVEYSNADGSHPSLVLLNDGMVQNQFISPGYSMNAYTYALERLAFAAVPDARTALVLGIGGGVVPSHFAEDDVDVEAVDINAKMVRIAKEFLGFEQGRIKIDIEDARTAARHCRKHNDVVTVDLFREDGIPEHLVTREFFGDIRNCMSDKGAMVMNSFMDHENPAAEYALLQTIASVFGEVVFFEAPPENNVTVGSAYIVARKGAPVGALDISLAAIPPAAVKELAATVKTPRVIHADDPFLNGAPVLTDVSNQWKRLATSAELNYRRTVHKYMPWQILIN